MQTLRARCSLLVVLLLAVAPGVAGQREAVSTRPRLDFTPFTGPWNDRAEVVPVLAGDLVLATTTLRLFAFDSRTAELRWSAGPPDGWSELEQPARLRLYTGMGKQLRIAPAAGERVAVAALQVPLSRSMTEDWQGLQITTSLPERRLFAFEMGTGRALWNHAPPRDWNGSNGSFAQNMSLCAAPTVSGACVLVPCVSDDSSVNYHVSCHELTTGELLWSTFVVRGQVERNMFGKTVVEFDAAPLVAVRERRLVLAQTGLGVVAALDLATGKVLWRTDYSSIPIPKTRSYSPSMRETAWKTTPPVITGDVVLATPRDSRELLALDIADGHVLWRVEDSALSTIEPPSGKADVDHLIGVEGNVLYFGGIRPAAFIKRSGMRSMEAPERLWSSTDVRAIRGRGQLSSDGLYVPLNDGLSTRHSSACLVLDRESGKSTASHRLNSGSRGLLVTDEALYVVTDNGLERIER